MARHPQTPVVVSVPSSPAPSAPPSQFDRAELALRITSLLGTFWGSDDTADEIRAIELETWLDTLGNMSCDQFRDAWVEYQRSGPRTAKGRLYKPDAGAIWKLVQEGQADQAPRQDVAANWAKAIKTPGSYVGQSWISSRVINEMLGRGLVTQADLDARGIR